MNRARHTTRTEPSCGRPLTFLWGACLSLAVSACCASGTAEPVSPAPSVPAPTPVVTVPRDVSETESDRSITEQIRRRYGEDYEVSAVAAGVGIATVRGVVTLSGAVETDRQRTVMAGHARSTDGVARVEDLIVVVP